MIDPLDGGPITAADLRVAVSTLRGSATQPTPVPCDCCGEPVLCYQMPANPAIPRWELEAAGVLDVTCPDCETHVDY